MFNWFKKKEKEKPVFDAECFRCEKFSECNFANDYVFCKILKHVWDGGSCPAFELDPSVDK